MDLSALTALTWVALIADVIALWAYRRDANTAVLRRLVPSMLVGVCLGAPLRAVSAQTQMRRVIGAILLPTERGSFPCREASQRGLRMSPQRRHIRLGS